MRHKILAGSLLCLGIFVALAMVRPMARAGARPIEDQLYPPNYVPSGQVMYMQYCAACHGTDAKGDGPAAAMLKTMPADLTQLTKDFAMRHPGSAEAGKFPSQYVSAVLRFGPGPSAHGSADMPTWGPIFQLMDKNDAEAVRKRIKNLSDYLASVQEK